MFWTGYPSQKDRGTCMKLTGWNIINVVYGSDIWTKCSHTQEISRLENICANQGVQSIAPVKMAFSLDFIKYTISIHDRSRSLLPYHIMCGNTQLYSDRIVCSVIVLSLQRQHSSGHFCSKPCQIISLVNFQISFCRLLSRIIFILFASVQ